MIDSIRIEFRKLDSKTWSNSDYKVLVKLVDYAEFDSDNQFGPEYSTRFKSLEKSLKNVKRAKSSISQFESLISFIETKSPERWQIVFFLEENGFRHSNSALNVLEVYF